MYGQSGPYPGPTPQYGQAQYPPQAYVPPTQQIYGNGDVKDPYEGDRFKPKKKINDPIFLILFILQVSIPPYTFLAELIWYLQLVGFTVLSAIALHSWISQGGLGGGLGKAGGHTGTSVTLNR